MFSAKEIFGVTVKGTLAKRVEVINFDGVVEPEKVSELTRAVIDESKMITSVPDYLSVITLRLSEDSAEVDSVKITLKTRSKDVIYNDNLKVSTIIPYNSSYKEMLVNFVTEWVDSYLVAYKAQVNADALSAVTLGLSGAVKVSFAYSDLTIVSMTNKSIVLGLSAEALAYVPNLEIFSDVEYVSSTAKEMLGVALQTIEAPYEVLTSKNRTLKELGIYTRVGVAKLLKRTYKKNINTAAASIEALNEKRMKESSTVIPITESPVCKFEYTDEVGSFFGLVKCIKTDTVKDGVPVAFEKDGYSYVFVLSPFNKKLEVLSDEEAAGLLELMIA